MDITLENKEKIITLLREGICPICGNKYKNPLCHINKKHGISKNQLKDTLLIRQKSSFVSPDLSEKLRKTAIKHNLVSYMHAAERVNPDITDAAREKHRISMSDQWKRNSAALREASRENIQKAGKKSAKSRQKPVIRITDDGQTTLYDSIKDAANANGVPSSSIISCLKGISHKSAGHKWQYAAKNK